MKDVLMHLLAVFGAQMVLLLADFMIFQPEELTTAEVVLSYLAAYFFCWEDEWIGGDEDEEE